MRVTVPSFAKLNLDLRVLSKRSDGYHDLRTIFQTISLKDTLRIDFELAKRTQIELDSSIEIADNLVVRAARLILEQTKTKAHVRFALNKQIPMGAGLGGGSSNAAATLIALSALVRKPPPFAKLSAMAATLGSDVPFFLHGGTALGLGRGTELYPLPDLPTHPALIVSTGVHVSTAEAYRSLGRTVANAATLTSESSGLSEFQSACWSLGETAVANLTFKNDFEDAVFQVYPELAALVRKLRKLGAKPARMTGSGSAVFGVFASAAQVKRAANAFGNARSLPVRLVNRKQYLTVWRRALGPGAFHWR